MKLKFPKCSGRPQLWWSEGYRGNGDRLRIIFSDGRVSYFFSGNGLWIENGRTSAPTQAEAQLNVASYSRVYGEWLEFLGYL